MAKQMHQIDDDENPGKGGFFHGFESAEPAQKPIGSLRPEAQGDHTPQKTPRSLVHGTVSLAWAQKSF